MRRRFCSGADAASSLRGRRFEEMRPFRSALIVMEAGNSGELVRRMLSGDDTAFAFLVERHAFRLRVHIRRCAAGAARADFDDDDIFQAVVFRAWRSRAAYADRGPGSFYAWIAALAKNLVLNRVRYLSAEQRKSPSNGATEEVFFSDIPASVTSISSRVGRRDDIERLASAVEALPDLRRRIVECHHFEGLSIRETAARLEVPRSTVADELKAAMDLLKVYFRDEPA